MRRIPLLAVVLSSAGFGIVAARAAERQSAPAAARSSYDPFAMERAATAAPGSAENNAFNRRQEIVKRLKDNVRPPHHPGNRSPHVPGEPFHDKNGDGIEDHGGHGNPH